MTAPLRFKDNRNLNEVIEFQEARIEAMKAALRLLIAERDYWRYCAEGEQKEKEHERRNAVSD